MDFECSFIRWTGHATVGLPGLGSLYIDNQGTQGFMYNPKRSNRTAFGIRRLGQAWSGALTTFGPQLSIGLIKAPTRSVLR